MFGTGYEAKMKTTHWSSELSVKLQIINTPLEFVADFWKFETEKEFEENVMEKYRN
jgi:hypothetical protein